MVAVDGSGGEIYRERLPQVELIQFQDSGHELWLPD